MKRIFECRQTVAPRWRLLRCLGLIVVLAGCVCAFSTMFGNEVPLKCTPVFVFSGRTISRNYYWLTDREFVVERLPGTGSAKLECFTFLPSVEVTLSKDTEKRASSALFWLGYGKGVANMAIAEQHKLSASVTAIPLGGRTIVMPRDVRPVEFVRSQDHSRIAWLMVHESAPSWTRIIRKLSPRIWVHLVHRHWEIWLSDRDGTGMHNLGQINEGQATPEIRALEWLPGGKISFIRNDTLYTAATNGAGIP